MTTTMEYIVTHTFTTTVIFAIVVKVIGDVTMGYFAMSTAESAGMTVNNFNVVPVRELKNVTSIIAAVFMEQFVQQLQQLMVAVVHNVTTETVTATITAPPYTTRPAPPTFTFDHDQISWFREFVDSMESKQKYKPTPAGTPVFTGDPQWWPRTPSRPLYQIPDGQPQAHPVAQPARPQLPYN